MGNQVRVEIGGVGFLLRYKDYRIKKEQKGVLYIKDFIQPGRNDFVIELEIGRLPEYPKNKMLFQARENWRSYMHNGDCVFEIYKSQQNENNQKTTQVCLIKKGLPKAVVHILPEDNTGTWSLEELMRTMGQLIAISTLGRFQGLLIHSAGVTLDGEGIVFTGISRAGKTTLAKLWQQKKKAIVLSDDRVIVRRQRQAYFVYGSPWPGEGKMASNKRAPLKKILFLSRAKRNKLTPLGRRESCHRLIAQCFPAIWDKASIDFSLRFCGALAEDVPCYSFGFVPEKSAVEFIAGRINND